MCFCVSVFVLLELLSREAGDSNPVETANYFLARVEAHSQLHSEGDEEAHVLRLQAEGRGQVHGSGLRPCHVRRIRLQRYPHTNRKRLRSKSLYSLKF